MREKILFNKQKLSPTLVKCKTAQAYVQDNNLCKQQNINTRILCKDQNTNIFPSYEKISDSTWKPENEASTSNLIVMTQNN